MAAFSASIKVVYYFRGSCTEASSEAVAISSENFEYFHESGRHPCESNFPASFGLLPWKRVGTSIETMEASIEVLEAIMQVVEASIEVVEASVVVNVPRLPRKLMEAFTTFMKAGGSFRNLWKFARKLPRLP